MVPVNLTSTHCSALLFGSPLPQRVNLQEEELTHCQELQNWGHLLLAPSQEWATPSLTSRLRDGVSQ